MIRALLELLPRSSRPKMLVHGLLNVSSVVLRAVGTVLLVPLITALFSPTPTDAWPWVAALVGITMLGWLVDWVVTRIGFTLGFTLLDTAQRTVAERLARTPLTWFTAGNTASARQAIAATGPDLVGLVGYLITPVVGAVLLPIAISVALLPVSWQLALVALAGVPVLLGAYVASSGLSRGADRVAAERNSALTERIVEFARTQQALRAARRVDPARSHVGQALASQHGATIRLLFMQIPGQILFSVASQLMLIALAAAIVLLTLGRTIEPVEAVALIVVVGRYLEPFTTLAELSGGIEPTLATLRRIRTVVEAPVLPHGAERLTPSAPPVIEFRGVGFGYGDGRDRVLDGFDLTVEAGSTTAIVGPSGSGKSTVLALLAGLHEPSEGSVRVDGVDLARLHPDDRLGLVSAVFQHPYLFDGTVRENVLAGAADADDARVAQVASLARVDSVVERLPNAWESPVGEGGTTLSGGERQRVSIARALLKRAPLLLIDEATSALDTENERAITAALTDDPVPRTRLVVAHRLASIRHADRVVFLEDGRIVEDGTIDALLAADGRFAEFWRQQDLAAGWRMGRDEPA